MCAESQKSFALGVQWIAVRLLGTIPAPILFGSLIDVSCELWQDTCKEQGACLFYDNQLMSTNVLILACVLKSLSCIFFFLPGCCTVLRRFRRECRKHHQGRQLRPCRIKSQRNHPN
ncbi:solute carrier organic anion transporter family member 4A1 [Caerostris extrusa]|uniref:Solute carrier organic anion transporter family member 4A1 n=1 Tax=Caerostris extrusa TaxID=172846 RepID=A0AAV4WEH1_CAEEX|nr:solute carrier organic anion transporter family member 4A1 [Caerostris extrusa]